MLLSYLVFGLNDLSEIFAVEKSLSVILSTISITLVLLSFNDFFSTWIQLAT